MPELYKVNKNPDLNGAELVKAWQEAQARGMTQGALAKALGMSYTTFSSRYYRAVQNIDTPPAPPKPEYWQIELPDFDQGWRLQGDFMICGDVHAPFTDPDFAPLLWQVAERYLPSPRRLIVAGDLWDMINFSSYADVVGRPTFAQENGFVKAWIKDCLRVFDRIYILLGNHERRLQKWMKGQFEAPDLLSLITSDPRVELSVLGWCVVDTVNGPYRITHPRNYSINQLNVADALAHKHQMHIISHHEHHLAKGWDRYKNYVIVNNGMLANPGKFAYVNLDDSKSAGMTRGFCLLKNGTPYLFGETPFTDWAFLER